MTEYDFIQTALLCQQKIFSLKYHVKFILLSEV